MCCTSSTWNKTSCAPATCIQLVGSTRISALRLAISSHFSMTWSIIDAATLNVHAGTNTALWSVHSQCSSFHLQNTELTLWVYAVEGRSFERGNQKLIINYCANYRVVFHNVIIIVEVQYFNYLGPICPQNNHTNRLPIYHLWSLPYLYAKHGSISCGHANSSKRATFLCAGYVCGNDVMITSSLGTILVCWKGLGYCVQSLESPLVQGIHHVYTTGGRKMI